jgi:hypothetical protein
VLDLDQWLPNPATRIHHRRDAACNRATLWAAAETVTIGESGLLGRLIRWRVPGARREQTYRGLFTTRPFVMLDEGDYHLLAGVCGKIWTVRPALTAVRSPSEFRQWRVPGTVRVLFAHWVTVTPAGAALISEIRVAPADGHASLRLRGLAPMIGRFQRLIGTEALQLAVRRAERQTTVEAQSTAASEQR